MNTNRSLEAIVAQWQAELDAGLEIGETPVFYLGQGPAMLGELVGPLALQWLDEERRDTRMPLAAGGGLAPFWLAALLHQRVAGCTPALARHGLFLYGTRSGDARRCAQPARHAPFAIPPPPS